MALLTKSRRLEIVIAVSSCFFLAEISVGFHTRSLALLADAFHYMNDVVTFVTALVALKISEREYAPQKLSFGWQRAEILGAFFNGTFLLASGVCIFLQSIERFISLQRVQSPMLMLIMGGIGLTLNIISVLFLHDHDHGHGNSIGDPALAASSSSIEEHAHKGHRHNSVNLVVDHEHHDLGIMGVLVHLIGDAINNIGVMIAAIVIWRLNHEARFYADPAISIGISVMIILSAGPVCREAGSILLESTPLGVSLEDIRYDLEQIPGVLSVHELHAWQLCQQKALVSAHVITTDDSLTSFMIQAKIINECLHAYGIHSATLQPEVVSKAQLQDSLKLQLEIDDGDFDLSDTAGGKEEEMEPTHRRSLNLNAVRTMLATSKRKEACQIRCGTLCEQLTCCG